MLRFVVARTGQMVASLWVAMSLLFLVITVLPGDPVRALFGFQPPPPQVYDAIVAQYHLDQPLWRQYLLYLADVATGDLGRSFPRNPFGNARETVEVTDVIASTAPVSARLLLLALAVQVVVGVSAGTLSAQRGARGGRALPAVAVLLVATPVVVAAYVLRTVVGVQLGWLPRAGLFDGALSYVLPVLALAGLSTGFVMLLTRSEVRTALSTPYLRAARGRGIPEARLLAVHALRPALVPIVAFVAANLGPTLVGLIVVEGVFQLPGLGGALLGSIRGRDRGLMVGLVAFVMALVIVATAVADVVTAWLDPRIRLDGGRG